MIFPGVEQTDQLSLGQAWEADTSGADMTVVFIVVFFAIWRWNANYL